MTIKINPNNQTSFKGGKPWMLTVKEGGLVQKTIETVGRWSTPETRLVLGATALATQPWIDFKNKDVDEETRKISCARTIAKIIAGTTTGYFIRKWTIDATKNWTDLSADASKNSWKTAFLPTKYDPAKLKELIGAHRKAVGSCLALFVMIFTNFALDVPITKFLTNLINKKMQKPQEEKIQPKGGN